MARKQLEGQKRWGRNRVRMKRGREEKGRGKLKGEVNKTGCGN